MQIQLVKWLDGVVGAFLAACLPAAQAREVAVMRSILLIRPGGIGDAVLLIPAILALRQRFPEAQISVLAERRNATVFSLCPAIHQLFLYDNPSNLLKVICGGFDLVIDTEQWHRLSAVVARFTRARVSIGFSTNGRKRLFAHQIAYSHEEYEAISFFNLLAPLKIAPPAALRVPFLIVPDPAARRAADLLAPVSGMRFVAIFPGASIAERHWGGERFKEIAGRLSQAGVAVVVVGGKEDADEGELIVADSGGLNLAGKTTLAETAAILARSALLLSSDSGVLHIAVGLGIQTVSLFGPGIQAKWGPKGEKDLVITRRLPCSPCTLFGTTPPCPIKVRCMTEISVDEITAAVVKLLN